MEIWVVIYLVGFVVAFIYSVQRLTKDGHFHGTDIIIGLVMAIFSWTMVLGLWVAGNIGNHRE